MSDTLRQVIELAGRGEVKISEHGYEELAADDLLARDIIEGLGTAEVVEDYPDFLKGPCVLVLQRDREGREVHAVRGIPCGESGPGVLVTAYRPDPEKWSEDFMTRR